MELEGFYPKHKGKSVTRLRQQGQLCVLRGGRAEGHPDWSGEEPSLPRGLLRAACLGARGVIAAGRATRGVGGVIAVLKGRTGEMVAPVSARVQSVTLKPTSDRVKVLLLKSDLTQFVEGAGHTDLRDRQGTGESLTSLRSRKGPAAERGRWQTSLQGVSAFGAPEAELLRINQC